MQPHRQHSEDNETPLAGADDAVVAIGPCSGASVSNAVTMPVLGGSAGILRTFAGLADNRTDHFTLTFAYVASPPPLVRVHSSCMTGDVLGSERCDCGFQLAEAKRRLMTEGGILIYLQQEGRGIGLAAKIAAYALQDRGLDTYEANRALGFSDDERQYGVAAQMLKAQDVTQIRLLSNNPNKAVQLRRCGIDVVAIEPTAVNVTAHNRRYLEAKRDKTGHTLALEPAEDSPIDESRS